MATDPELVEAWEKYITSWPTYHADDHGAWCLEVNTYDNDDAVEVTQRITIDSTLADALAAARERVSPSQCVFVRRRCRGGLTEAITAVYHDACIVYGQIL